MDLKGAKIVDFYQISSDVKTDNTQINMIKIPHYQRPYRWDKDKVSKLIEDWSKHDAHSDKEYFAGSIVTVADESGNAHELVDGQQRFTTIYLVNYLLFLLLRVTTRQGITQSKTLRMEALLNDYKASEMHIFKSPKNTDIAQNLMLSIEALEELDGQEKEEKREKLACDFMNKSGLPTIHEGSDEYIETYTRNLAAMTQSQRLLLTYDRESFNPELHKALSHTLVTLTDQNEPRLTIIQNDNSEVVKQYTDAIEQIFLSFKGLTDEKKPFEIALAMTKTIQKFLKNLKLCLVQTGNHKDAYTLFEVLNDRSMALADLDLIKNEFYRQYCLQSKENGSVVNATIEARENQWGDFIYNENADYKKKLITYLATAYLTGSSKIGYNQNEKYRIEIKEYLSGYKAYSSSDIDIDFNIFQACQIFITHLDIVHQKTDQKALKSEYSKEHSQLYKTVHLLNALKYNAVLPGICNLVLRYIQKNISDNFEPKKVKAFIVQITKSAEIPQELELQAKKITQLALLNKDFRLAKSLANKLISENYRGSIKDVVYSDDTPLNDNNKSTFNDWIDAWQYGSDNLKVRILFAKLLPTSVSDGKLTIKNISHGISDDLIERIQLDHMEPSNLDSSRADEYFQNHSRGLIVNSLGNMFPLSGTLNISKSNRPCKSSFEFLKKDGMENHWLSSETERIFNENNTNGVPTELFFSTRRNELKKWFYEAISL